MAARSLVPRLTDIIEAIERIHVVLENITLEAFESDWQRQWLVERGIEIISEASRHLTDEMKARHPEIPWQNVAGIGNVLRQKYENIAAPIIWKLAHADLPALQKACRNELRKRDRPRKSGLTFVSVAADGAARDLRICLLLTMSNPPSLGAGIERIDENGGGPGVRLQKPPKQKR